MVEVGRGELAITGPVKQFTIELDLEKSCICVWGQTPKGYLRYRLFAQESQLIIEPIKRPEGWSSTVSGIVTVSDVVQEGVTRSYEQVKERLFLGVNKAQDWELILRRFDLRELIPFWLRLASLIPFSEPIESASKSGSLLQALQEAIEDEKREEAVETLEQLFLGGLQGMLVPSSQDLHHLGLSKPPLASPAQSPLTLLKEGAFWMRRLFVQEQPQELRILPLLPKQMVQGRLIHASLSVGELDLEWTKGTLRRAILRPSRSERIRLHLHPTIRRFRLRKGNLSKGVVLDARALIDISEKEELFFDRFEK
jgi:hypothetical protein